MADRMDGDGLAPAAAPRHRMVPFDPLARTAPPNTSDYPRPSCPPSVWTRATTSRCSGRSRAMGFAVGMRSVNVSIAVIFMGAILARMTTIEQEYADARPKSRALELAEKRSASFSQASARTRIQQLSR